MVGHQHCLAISAILNSLTLMISLSLSLSAQQPNTLENFVAAVEVLTHTDNDDEVCAVFVRHEHDLMLRVPLLIRSSWFFRRDVHCI